MNKTKTRLRVTPSCPYKECRWAERGKGLDDYQRGVAFPGEPVRPTCCQFRWLEILAAPFSAGSSHFWPPACSYSYKLLSGKAKKKKKNEWSSCQKSRRSLGADLVKRGLERVCLLPLLLLPAPASSGRACTGGWLQGTADVSPHDTTDSSLICLQNAHDQIPPPSSSSSQDFPQVQRTD